MRKSLLIFFLQLFCLSGLRAAEPTTSSSNVVVAGKQCVSANISWTRGNGSWCTVIIRQGSAVNVLPVDGVKYTAFNSFGSGSEIGSGNFVVYDNVSNNVSLSGLTPNTTYHIAIFEHDGFSPDYLTSSYATASFTTHFLNMDFSFSRTDSCEKTNNVIFTNKSTASFGWITYTWLYRDGNRDTGFNATHTYNIGGNFQVQILASPTLGCPNSFTNTKSVFIVPRPVSNPTVKNWDTAQCFQGNHFYFEDKTSVAPIPRCGKRVMWYLDYNDSTTFPNPDKYYPKAGKYRVFFKSETTYGLNSIVYNTGCIDTTSFYIRVIPDPTTGVTINDSIQCLAGNSFDFNNVYGGLTAFQWDLGDGTNSAVKNIIHSYANTGIYQIIHTATSAEGCQGKDTTFAVVKPNTNASFTGLPASVCERSPDIILNPTSPSGVFSGGIFNGNRFINSTPGTYTVKYVVSDTFCPDSATATINVLPLPRFSLGRDTTLCDGNSVNLTVTKPGTILWDDGSSLTSRTIGTAGSFWARLDDQGCVWGDTINVGIGLVPRVSLPGDTLLCKGGVLMLDATWPNSQYYWNTGETTPTVFTSRAGYYSVTVSNPCGTATDDVNVLYQGEFCDLFIPDAFTPNNDGKNDLFQISGRNIVPVLFQIYDRWGAKVFDSQTSGIYGWNGKVSDADCMDGVYQYIFQYEVPAGTRVRRSTIKGSVLLYR